MIRVCLFTFILVAHRLSTIKTEDRCYYYNTNVSMNGENLPYDGEVVSKVWFRMVRLYKGSIRNFPKLTTIYVVDICLEEIDPQAFLNVPRLELISMRYSKLKTIQKDVFNIIPSITTLLLNENKIDFIASGSFSNLEKLDTINLSDNSLMVWNAEWFENCKALRIMDFSNNKIPNIPRRAFAELPRLKNISFENNEITTIQTDSFRNLENLTSLNLAHNRLTIIDEKAFPNSIYIHTLRIHSNYLNYLPNQLLRKLSVREIFLDYNPWKCSCLDVLNYWMFFTNARPQMVPGCKSPFAPICAVSRRYTKTCRESVEEDLTLRYIGLLNSLPQPLGKRCARLD